MLLLAEATSLKSFFFFIRMITIRYADDNVVYNTLNRKIRRINFKLTIWFVFRCLPHYTSSPHRIIRIVKPAVVVCNPALRIKYTIYSDLFFIKRTAGWSSGGEVRHKTQPNVMNRFNSNRISG